MSEASDHDRRDPVSGRSRALMVKLAILLLVVTAGGCGKSVQVVVHRLDPPPPGTPNRLLVGMAVKDITPPPGLPPFGFGGSARHKRFVGHRTRLKARALVLEDAAGDTLALVTLDLGCSSSLLHWRVAEMVAGETGITVDRLMLAATHTHSGPGGFAANGAYNRFGVPGGDSGFDAGLLDFLAGRVAAAVRTAYDTRSEARVAIGQRKIEGLTRNRSPKAYVANKGATNDLDRIRRCAVDPTLTMIRVDREDNGGVVRIGAFSIFSAHPTVMGTDNDLWHADVFGVACTLLEQRYGPDVVFALANGAEGDVSFSWNEQTHEEAMQLGRVLADHMDHLYHELESDTACVDASNIDHRYEEVQLSHAAVEGSKLLCKEPRIGWSAAAGAEDGRSGFPFVYEGMQSWLPFSCHAQKPVILGPLQGFIIDSDEQPKVAPIQLIRIGPLHLVAVPFEVTTMTGRRIREEVAEKIREGGGGPIDPQRDVLVIGLANDYISYCATAEEYTRQHYEGASTLYGPHTARFLALRTADLAHDLHFEPYADPDLPRYRVFFPGPEARRFDGDRPTRLPAGFKRCIKDYSVDHRSAGIRWRGLPRERISIHAGPLVFVEVQTSSGWSRQITPLGSESDEGLNFQVKQIADRGADAIWEATWFYPVSVDRARTYRLVVESRASLKPLIGKDFTIPGGTR